MKEKLSFFLEKRAIELQQRSTTQWMFNIQRRWRCILTFTHFAFGFEEVVEGM
jgi:hypothetical protein